MGMGRERQAPANLLTGKGHGTHFTGDLVGPRTLLGGYRKENLFFSSRVRGQISQPYRLVVLSL